MPVDEFSDSEVEILTGGALRMIYSMRQEDASCRRQGVKAKECIGEIGGERWSDLERYHSPPRDGKFPTDLFLLNF